MRTLFVIVTSILLSHLGVDAQDKYTSKSGYVSFFSKAPITDVDARNEKVKVEMDISNGEVSFDITMTDFKFKNKKMGRDARKKYLEIDKHPKAGFKGKIQGKIDYNKPDSYKVTATGKLKIHGVEKNVIEKGTITVGEKGQVKLQCEFSVTLADYQIETPEILGKEMAEDKVLVKVEATLTKVTKGDVSKKK